MKYEINIMMGLPGSGKSFYSHELHKELEKDDKNKCYYLDLDEYIKIKPSDLKSVFIHHLTYKTLLKDKYYMVGRHQRIIIDGLILTLKELNIIIDTCLDFIQPNNDDIITFNIHHWNEDRETCLFNDNIRVKYGIRDKSSELTIKNTPYDNIEYYGRTNKIDGVTFNIVKHNVFKCDIFDGAIKNYGYQDKKGEYILTSQTWSGGGTWCNCWGNSGNIEADTDLEFIEFDNLLTKICPNITFLQYKQIYKSCVDKTSYYERDYYGGSELRYQYTCNLNTLYNKLIEMKLIENYE